MEVDSHHQLQKAQDCIVANTSCTGTAKATHYVRSAGIVCCNKALLTETRSMTRELLPRCFTAVLVGVVRSATLSGAKGEHQPLGHLWEMRKRQCLTRGEEKEGGPLMTNYALRNSGGPRMVHVSTAIPSPSLYPRTLESIVQ